MANADRHESEQEMIERRRREGDDAGASGQGGRSDRASSHRSESDRHGATEGPDRGDWAGPEGGGSREDARERVRDGAESADASPSPDTPGGNGDPDHARRREDGDQGDLTTGDEGSASGRLAG